MIRIEIKTDNAAFGGMNKEREIERILLKIVEDLTIHDLPQSLYDVNGNSVGRVWETK